MKSAMRRSIADIWSRSARILSSGGMSVDGTANGAAVVRGCALGRDGLEPADLADAQAWRIGDRDLRLVEHHAAVDRVGRAQRRAVEIDLGDDVGLGHGHVHRGRHADAGFEHAADHAVDAVHRGDVCDADRVGDAAGLHQLDVDDVGGTHADQLDHLHRPEHALVGHDRRVHALGDVAHAFEVVGLDRLFDQLQAYAGVLQCLDREHRLFRSPALVGIEAQQGAVLDRGVDRLDPLDVDADVLADLDLQRLEAAIHCAERVGHHLVDVVDADGDVGGDHRVSAAEHLVQRCAVELPPQVVDRDLDGGLGAGVLLQRGLDQVGDAVEVVDFLADQARGDVPADRLDDRTVRVAGDHRRGGRFAVADMAGVGVHRHDDVFDRVDGAQRGLERRLQRDPDHAEADFGDFHAVAAREKSDEGEGTITVGCAGYWWRGRYRSAWR